MKKRLTALIAAAICFCSMSFPALAAETAVVFTSDSKLEYTGAADNGAGGVVLGSFDTVAPGETVTQTVLLENRNSLTVDFYMSAETLTALEEAAAAGQTAGGAAYTITLTAGNDTLYDSSLGGYSDENSADGAGLKSMNEALQDYLLVGTLAPGESKMLSMSIFFDGESMDNSAGGVDYSNTLGQIAFQFMVSYEEPAGPVIINRDVIKETPAEGNGNLLTQIADQLVPLAPVQTSDAAMLGLAAAVLAGGVLLLVFAGRRKKED